jgi:DNA-binding NarL/FixJ family response regulator
VSKICFEKPIVGHLLQARTYREIAGELRISEKPVKHYMSGLMVKLKARNRVEAARKRSESTSEPKSTLARRSEAEMAQSA